MIGSGAAETKLYETILDFEDDPLGFVKFIFPWGEPNSRLELLKPRQWQIDVLTDIGNHIKAQKQAMREGKHPQMMQLAVASGRGIGKSTLIAWLILWMLSVRNGSKVLVSATNETQVKSVTWAELGKWHAMALNSHWFERSTESMMPAGWFKKELEKQLQMDSSYYGAGIKLWSSENPDGYAGPHNDVGMMVIFDEASGIDTPIWPVAKGYFTELNPYRFWFAFSNPRKASGAFFNCFHDQSESWNHRQIDSRSLADVDPKIYQDIIDEHGPNSNEAKVEVYGQFPSLSDKQFIDTDSVMEARLREVEPDPEAPLIMGVDIAHRGADKTVIRWRQGFNGRVLPPVKRSGLSPIEVEHLIATWADKTNPDGICVDAGNTGSGIIEHLRKAKYRIHEVWFGAKSPEPEWADMATFMWAEMRTWLARGAIDNDKDLMSNLTVREWVEAGRGDAVRLEAKDKLRARKLPSPDDADALALTFAKKFPRRDSRASNIVARSAMASGTDYDPLNP